MTQHGIVLGPAFQKRTLEQLVENRTSFQGSHSELHIYETHATARAVSLQFREPVLTSMIMGKKVMHLQGIKAFDYMPGESLILPGNEPMQIDFPEASATTPTKCLALAISPDLIRDTVAYVNDRMPRVAEEGEWGFMEDNYHLLNDASVSSLLNRLIGVFLEGNTARDIFVDLCLQELLIRLMQTRARNLLVQQYAQYRNSHRMAHVAAYIRENLYRSISVGELASQACMSEPAFFRSFKHQFGLTPIEYINQERITLAKQLLNEKHLSVTEISFACGYNNMSYFISQFKKQLAFTPTQWRHRLKKSSH
ncbi:AraC family transcriptional regulator [Cesiribacter andamanensis]|uniref:L-rhamnose operon transcriptional activator rhaR n=1 Tax=Cesiribacter andamanensis AMV16 TaxID=1279009 RepID=M7NC45_9BACT|nr:AraC family transcriptional regulator [Cesiribacter andamanensis]EMR04736.1 L-rhamnose operon transcriptional activator rhaR [Cesiribacter andamanensis AMV16]